MKLTVRTVPLLLFLLIPICILSAGGQQEFLHQEDHHSEDLPVVFQVVPETASRLAVAATTSMVGDIAARVGGDRIDLTVLMAPGQDPHSYEPTPKQLAAVETAHLVLVNGFGLEEGLLGTVGNIAGGVIVPVSAGIEESHDSSHQEETSHEEHHHAGHHHEGTDPHTWMNPRNVILWAENIEQVLSAADPAGAEYYRANRDRLIAELEEADRYIEALAASVPREKRKLITDHNVFGYFAGRYGFDVMGAVIPGFSTSAEPSPREMAALVELIRAEDVGLIVISSTAGRGTRKMAEALKKETGRDVRIVEVMTGTLAPAGERGDSYTEFIRMIAEAIASGLTGQGTE